MAVKVSFFFEKGQYIEEKRLSLHGKKYFCFINNSFVKYDLLT